MADKINSSTSSYYACINCGNTLQHLYQKINENVIKLTKCDKCKEIADKYVEFEQVTILIDSVLLTRAAYRHILYNTNFKLYWKLALVLLLLESFALWRQKLKFNSPSSYVANNFIENFSHEHGFYWCCLENIIDCFITILILYVLTKCFGKNSNRFSNKFNQFIILCKSITLGNFAKFFFLPIMIWRDNTTELGTTLHYLLVYSYYLLACIHIYSAVTHLTIFKSFSLITSGFLLKQLIVTNLF